MSTIHPGSRVLKTRDKLLMQWVSWRFLPDHGNTVLGDDQEVIKRCNFF